MDVDTALILMVLGVLISFLVVTISSVRAMSRIQDEETQRLILKAIQELSKKIEGMKK